MDVVTLQPGTDFTEAIDEKVGFCDALVAVIGPRWLEGVDAGGRRRLDDPQDWVRLEIAAALSRGIKVIPALVGGAALPGAMQLPAPVAALASYQAIELRPARFEEDVERLETALQRVLAGGNAAVFWLALLARRHRALDPLDLHKPEVLWRALRFLLLMIVIGEILRLPAAARAGLEYWDIGYVAAYAMSGCVEWLALGVALHLAMRACGGRASLQKSIAVLCFLSAWLPLIALSQAPVWGLNISVLTDMADVGWSPAAAVQKMTGFVGGLGIYGTVRLVVSFVAATTLWADTVRLGVRGVPHPAPARSRAGGGRVRTRALGVLRLHRAVLRSAARQRVSRVRDSAPLAAARRLAGGRLPDAHAPPAVRRIRLYPRRARTGANARGLCARAVRRPPRSGPGGV